MGLIKRKRVTLHSKATWEAKRGIAKKLEDALNPDPNRTDILYYIEYPAFLEQLQQELVTRTKQMIRNHPNYKGVLVDLDRITGVPIIKIILV